MTSSALRSSPRLETGVVARRLLIAGSGIAVFIAAIVSASLVERMRAHDHKLSQGHDLLPSYAAGELVRTGHARELYNLYAVQAIEARTVRDADLQMDPRYGPWLNPPFFALPFAPLSALPYRSAAAVVLVINLTLLTGSLWMLGGMLQPSNIDEGPAIRLPLKWTNRALIPLILMTSMPFWQALCHQQNTFLSLFLSCAAVSCWLKVRAFPAGLLIGLLFFKPQLALAISIVLVACLGWRALAGLAISGVALLIFTLLALPGALADYFHQLPPIIHWLQVESPYNWGRQVTFTSFWRLLIQGHERGETTLIVKILARACMAGTAFCLTMAADAAFKRRGHTRSGKILLPRSRVHNLSSAAITDTRLIAAAITCMPLLMPYYMDYDLMLLAVPAVLFAAEWIDGGNTARTRTDRCLLGAWIALFVITAFNPGLAGQSRFDLTVPALAVVAGLSVWRCWQVGAARDSLNDDDGVHRIAA